MRSRTDTELVTASQGGDRAAMEELLGRHHDRLYAVCRGIAGADDAADATQAALMSVVRGLPRFDGRARFTTWSHRIAVNAALDELRRRKRRPEPVDPLGGSGDSSRERRELEGVPATSKVAMGTPSIDPAALVVDRQVVEAALAALREEFRVPLVLAEYGGLEYSEIAETLEIPVGTVRSRIARARAQLLDSGRGSP
ncbi:MAG: sigma-70 family RNA polymerase sigma factor [Microthrixaceae bacterium]